MSSVIPTPEPVACSDREKFLAALFKVPQYSDTQTAIRLWDKLESEHKEAKEDADRLAFIANNRKTSVAFSDFVAQCIAEGHSVVKHHKSPGKSPTTGEEAKVYESKLAALRAAIDEARSLI